MPASFEIRTLVVNPRLPKRVYAAGPAGLFRSEDAGRTWDTANQAPVGATITALAIDPSHPDRLYGASANGAVYVSEDTATTWRAITP